MAFVNGNKPIITNGLVYALDFGNQKSYVSGSNSAFNLVYSTTTSSLNSYNSGQKGVVANNSYQFTMLDGHPYISSSYFLTQALTFLDTASEYTVTAVVEPKAGSYSGEPRYLASNLTAVGRNWGITYGTSGFTQYGIADGNVSIYSRQYPVGVSRQHVTYRYKSGSFDFFVNGVPVSASAINPSTFFRYQYGGGFSLGSPFQNSSEPNGYAFSGSLGLFYVYNRSLSSDEIYSNYLISAQRYGLPTPAKPYSLDENAYLFLQTAGITDPIITSSINTFVLGLKSASLWDKMIAIYPFVGTGSVGVNLTGSHKWNLKEPSLVTYPLVFTGSWNGSVSGSTPSGSGTAINTTVTPSTYYPNYANNNAHISILSYDTPVSSSILAGTGMTKELAVSTLAGDYGTPAAAYSVRKVRTAYSGALMDVRRSIDNVTQSFGYVSNGDLDTGSLSTFVNAVGEYSPGNYSGLAAAYSLRKVSASYSGNAIDVRRIWDNTTSSIGFDSNGNLNTGSLLNFTTSGSNIFPYSNNFNQADWTKYDVQITASAVLGPYGLGSGSFINETPASGFHVFDENSNPVNTSSIHTISCFVKKQERRYVGLAFAYNGANHSYVTFDLDTTSSISSGSAGTGYLVASSSINYVTDGWFRISLIGTVGLNDFYPRFYLTKDTTGYQPTYVGEPGTGSYVYGFQYTTGSTVQPYIPTNGTALFNVGNTSSFGYVSQWYDQSGNGRHATQTATGSQPLIVSSGSLITENSKPVIQFDLNSFIPTPIDGNTVLPLNAFATVKVDSYGGIGAWYLGFTGTDLGKYELAQSSTGILTIYTTGSNSPRIGVTYSPANTTSLYLHAGLYDTSSLSTYVNSQVSESSKAIAEGSYYQTQNITIGSGRAVLRGNFKYAELLLYTSSQEANRTFIENNINTYYNVYTSSNAGYVARWYDQSGNNRHATQTTSSRQPLIVESGSVTTNSTRPGFKWNVSQSLTNVGSFTFNNVAWVAQATDSSGFGTIINTYRGFGASGEPLGDVYSLRANGSTYSYTGNQDDLTYIDGLMYYNGNLYTGNSILNRHLGFLKVGSGTYSSANGIQIGIHYASSRAWKGYINEVVLYSNDQLTNRGPIEYNINNYYNIYPQTSSFSTSSFAIYATTSSISASINNDLQSGIASSGPLGFITVSRTGSNSLTLARNGVTSSFAVPASGALSTNLYLGAINNNGLALGSSPYNISFASVGVGLTGTDTSNLTRLVGQLQNNLQRGATLNYYTTSSLLVTYALRKTNSLYTGSAIRVRRSFDNAETDIGFTGTNLDTATLLTFIGSGDGFIRTWYDQSGNGKNVGTSTTSLQPQIARSGSLYTVSSKPALYFNGGNLLSYTSSIASGSSQLSTYTVYSTINDNSYSTWSTGNGNNYWMYTNGYQGFLGIFTTTFTGTFPGRNTYNGNWLWSTFHSGSSRIVFVNNTQYGPETSLAFTTGSAFTIGGTDTGGGGLVGYIQEITIFPTANTSSRLEIENNINTYYSIY
jgi:hypothetical protein